MMRMLEISPQIEAPSVFIDIVNLGTPMENEHNESLIVLKCQSQFDEAYHPILR
jgi:hypothetical protein